VPLRLRLTLLYVVLLGIALAVFSLAVYLIARNRVSQNVDDALRLQADAVAIALEPAEGPLSVQSLGANKLLRLADEASAGVLFQIRDLESSVIYSSFEPSARNLPLPGDMIPEEETFSTTKIRGDSFRILYHPFFQDGQLLGSVVVGESLENTYETLNLIRDILIVGGVAVLVVTNIPAYLLAGRVLDPVRRVSRLARDIEAAADFTHRVPPSPAGDEMGELTATFNAMIDRVERTLESQKAFLADSSHELRRPLTVLRANIDILNDPALPAGEREACLKAMRTEAELMSRVLSDLLLLSREGTQEIARVPVDYSSVCERAIARLGGRDDRHELAAEIAPGVRVLGDEERLEQMLGNLLDNASQYTPDGGRIELRLHSEGGAAHVEVRDTGVGIAEDDLPHVFERFYRSKSARVASSDHSGLGLAIVQYIAEAHGGGIQAISRVGEGSTFTVDLPLLPASPS
jgi:two-component system OmpR family sensor kinase